MIKPDSIPTEPTREPDADLDIKLRRRTVLLRVVTMVKPWRRWVIASNLCIVLSSFFGVFSLLAIWPILNIIFMHGPQHADKHNLSHEMMHEIHLSHENLSGGTTATLHLHERRLQALHAEEAEVDARSHGVFSRFQHLHHKLVLKHNEAGEWIRIQALRDPIGTVYKICMFFALATLVSVLLDFTSDLLINHVQTQFLRDLTRRLYRHCLTHDLAFYNRHPLGSMLNRVYNDVLKLRSILQLLYGTRFRQPLTLFYMTVMLFIVDARLAAIILLSVPLFIIPALLISKRIRRISRGESGIDSSVMEIMEEQLGGARLIKSFGAEQREMERFDTANDDMYQRRWRRGVLQALNDPIMDFLIAIGLIIVILCGIKAVLGWGLVEGSTYLFFIITLSRFYSPLKNLTGVNVEIQRPLMSAEVIFKMLDTQPKLVDTPQSVPLPRPWHSITFRKVWFRYGRNSPYVLRNINLTLHAGQSVAILGHNGSGKTTLSSLLYRFYDPVGGRVEIDAIDLRTIRTGDLRHEFGNVGQHALLFNISITENIAFGVAPEQVDHARVRWAAQQTGADALIRELPEGYDTIVGRHGGRLSGGQRQLITLARVYYHHFSLIIYDEPTTHLDLEAEQAVMRCMHELRHEHTVVLITHNLQHALSFDRIVVMQAGEIVQDAAPSEIDHTLLRRLDQAEATA